MQLGVCINVVGAFGDHVKCMRYDGYSVTHHNNTNFNLCTDEVYRALNNTFPAYLQTRLMTARQFV
jgi:hypothetical protein